MRDDGTTSQEEWPPNQQEDFKCTVIIHYQEKFISKYTIEIYKTAKGGSRSHYSRNYTNISELFAPIDGKIKPKTILIEGISGIGKTLLVRQITSEWKNIAFLCEKEYVFLLNLWDPEVKKIFDVHGMIEYIFKNDYDMQMYGIKQIKNYICETNGSRLAVILDSDKEVRLDTNARMNYFFTNLIERKVAVLSECLILITSQPSYCQQLLCHVCRRVEMLGFSEDHKEEYLRVAFQHSPHKSEQLKQHIQNYPSIDVLCRIQLHLSFLVYLLKENIYLPTTQTKFFEKFVCCTFSRCLRLGKFDSLSQLESKHVKIVKELGKYSFNLLTMDKFTFSLKDLKEECPKYWSLVEPTANPCLLKKMQHFSSREATYSFLHLRVQEYLAAYYLSQIGWHKRYKFDNVLKKYFLECRYVNMWVLFYGITKEKGGGIFGIGNKAHDHRAKDLLSDSNNNQLKYLQLFQCYKEFDDEKMCSRIRDSLGYEIRLNDHHMLPENMITLCFAITQSSKYCNLTKLDLTNCKIGDSSCTYFYQQLKYCLPSSRGKISSLILSQNQLTQSSVNQIVDLTLRLEIKVLDLSNNHFSDVEADMLVKKCHCLNFLNLVDNNINNAYKQSINIFYSKNKSNLSIVFTRECLVFQQDNINDFTKYNTSVKSLFMDCTEVGYNQDINKFLQMATSLKVLHLRTQSKFEAHILNFRKIEELYVSQLSDEDADYYIKESNKSNFIIMITSKSKFYARNVQNDKMLNLVLDYKCFHGKNVNNIILIGCKISHKSISLLVELLKCTCRNIEQLTLWECELEDAHIYHFQNALKQQESNRLTVTRLDLSDNYLKSPDVIKLVCLLHIEELWLTNNQLQIQDTTMITDVLADENCHANYIDLQNNLIINVKDVCKKLFFFKNFNFNLIGAGHGCIITKRLHFKIQHGMRVNSLFFAFTEALIDQEFQDFLQSINSSEIVELNTLYIVMLQCKSWYRISERIKFLTVTDELYLCVPDMDITNLEFFSQYKCKRKLILSREELKALHIKNSEILCKTLDYVTAKSKAIVFESSNVCYTTIKNLARVLSKFNNSNDKRWDFLKLYNCNISDDHMEYFYETFIHFKKHGKILIKSVNLSNNKISQKSMAMINQLLEVWKVEELMIAENDLKSSGLLSLLRNNHITMNLRVLDTHQNKEDMNFHKEIQCFESFICNKETIFAHLTNKVLIVDGSVFTDLNNHELKMKTEVISIYLKFNTMKQDKLLLNIEKYLLSLDSLEVMFISISGNNTIDNKFLKLIKKVRITDKLIISAENMLESSFKLMIKHCELNCTTCISSRENLYITNSFEQLLNYTCVNKSCETATTISLKNCNNISNHSIKILANGLIDAKRKEKDLHLLEINNSSLVHTHIHEFCNTLTHNSSITSTIKILDLSNNYLDTNCMKDLIQVVSKLCIEELLLNNNQLQEDGTKQIMEVLTYSNGRLNYIDLQNNSLNNMENYFENVFFFHDFSFSIITTNSVDTTNGGCIITRSRLSRLNMQRAMVNCLYLAIRDDLADPDLQELSQALAPSTRVNRLYIAVLQSASLYHILKTIENLTVLVSEELYLCIPEMDSAIADRLWKHQCKSKLILSRKMLHAENVKDSEVIFKTLDYVNGDLEVIAIDKSCLCNKTIKKLASVLSNSNNIKIWHSFKLRQCNITDNHVKCFHKECIIDSKIRGKVQIKSVNLSNNKITSSVLEMIVKLVKQWQSEELLMAGNNIQYGLRTLFGLIATKEEIHVNNNQIHGSDIDAMDNLEPLKSCLKYVDLQNNQIQNADVLCKKYFCVADCNFIFITTKDGIIITKELLFSVQPKQNINSFYVAIREILPERGLLWIINVLPKVVKNLYISILLHNQSVSRLIQAVKCIEVVNEGLYLCTPEMDTSSVNTFWQHQCKSKLILSKQSLRATHIDQTEILFKTINCVTMNLIIISLENCDLSHKLMKKLAIVISNDSSVKTWNSFKLCKCNITDDHILCFYEQFIQCKRRGKIQIKSVNLSNNNISSSRIKEVTHLLELWKSEELIITGNYLRYNGLESLVHAITNECNSLYLQTLDARVNDVQCSREQITQLCELVVFNNNCNITNAKIQDFLILDGNCLDNNTNVTDATSICFTGNISASKQIAFLTNVQRLLLPFKICSLENLYVLMSGELNFDKSFFNVLKQITIARKLVINIKSIPGRSYMDAFVNQFESNVILGILSEQNLYISNSDDRLLHYMLNYMHQYYRNVTWVSINRCTMNKDSRSLDLLVKAMICKDKSIKCLALTNCEIGCNEIVTLQSNMAICHKQYECNNFIIERIDLSNNCIDSQCGQSLIELSNGIN